MSIPTIEDQTQAVYAAEDLWEKKASSRVCARFGDWHDVQPFYATVAARFRDAGEEVYPPTVRPRKGALEAHYDPTNTSVYIPPYSKGGSWALMVGTALHEFAHHLAPGEGHGPGFRAAFIECLEILGWHDDAELLAECYAQVGLTTSDQADGITDKVNKLLLHADKAATPEEQKTYVEKAESLAAEHSINLALLRKRQADADESERDRPITGQLYSLMALPNVTYRNLAVELSTAICNAHGCRSTIRGRSAYVTFYGFREDIHLTELMLTRITPMMFEAADEYLKSSEHKASGVATTSARIAFCKSFAWEIGSRLKEAVRQTEKRMHETLAITDGSVSTELVLRDKEIEVADYVEYEFKRIGARGSWKGSSTSTWSGTASEAGQNAAKNVNLFGRKELG